MRVLAFDIGQNNFAYCALQARSAEYSPCLVRFEDSLKVGDLCVEAWRVLQVTSAKRPSVQTVLDGVVQLVRDQLELIRSVDVVVIEQQMTRRMCVISACLFGAVRALAPAVQVYHQSASLKLGFGDLAAFLPGHSAALGTYCQRKQVAVKVARRLCGSAGDEAERTFASSKKKDDLADSLLHALAALAVRCTPPRAAPKRRRVESAAPVASASSASASSASASEATSGLGVQAPALGTATGVLASERKRRTLASRSAAGSSVAAADAPAPPPPPPPAPPQARARTTPTSKRRAKAPAQSSQ